jgi:(1->4)-alpha-D-glucan 1-alpha-D-glucosylmutase
MIATSTHDTKRSEDVRARINLLSEIPHEWAEAVQRWAEINQRHWRGRHVDRNAEYFLYQTMVGAWPLSIERAQTYMLKAIREAKAHTSWTTPDELYEQRISSFVESVYADEEFRRDFEAFVDPLIEPGRINSLAQMLIKLTAPNIPDIYQGTELWDLSLVDPDNRRPVDYDYRRGLLAELEHMSLEQILTRSDEGLPKLWLTRQTLRVRKEIEDAFSAQGSYEPLHAEGSRAEHVVAYLRGGKVAAIAPRLSLKVDGDWQGTQLQLPSGPWRNVLTGESFRSGHVELAVLLRRFPVALVAREATI